MAPVCCDHAAHRVTRASFPQNGQRFIYLLVHQEISRDESLPRCREGKPISSPSLVEQPLPRLFGSEGDRKALNV